MTQIAYALSATFFLIAYSAILVCFGGKAAVSMVALALLFTAASQYLAQSDERQWVQAAIVATYIAAALYAVAFVAFIFGV